VTWCDIRQTLYLIRILIASYILQIGSERAQWL